MKNSQCKQQTAALKKINHNMYKTTSTKYLKYQNAGGLRATEEAFIVAITCTKGLTKFCFQNKSAFI